MSSLLVRQSAETDGFQDTNCCCVMENFCHISQQVSPLTTVCQRLQLDTVLGKVGAVGHDDPLPIVDELRSGEEY